MIPIFSPAKSAYRADNLAAVQTAALGNLRGFQFVNGGADLHWSAFNRRFTTANQMFTASLSTDFDVSTAGSTTSTEFTVDASNATHDGFINGFLYLSSGATLIAAERVSGGNLEVFDFSVSPAYTGTETENFNFTDSTGSTYGLFLFSDAGAKLHIPIGRVIYVATLSTPYDISTMSSLSSEKDLSSDVSADINGMCWGRTEKQLLLTDGTDLFEYTLAVAGNIATVGSAATRTWSVPSEAYGIGFANGGRKFYATGAFGIQEYDAVA